jgi:predicted TIM-barrel fold metal-dependent hydrolase
MNGRIVRHIEKLLSFLSERKDNLVIDADAHITDLTLLSEQHHQKYVTTPNYYHGRPISAEDLLAEMKMADVDMSLIWQNPATTVYEANDQDGNYEKLLQVNRYILDSFLAHPLKFIPAGWTDPKALGLKNALRLVHVLMEEFGFFIVKMNPAQNAYPMYSGDVIQCVDKIIALGGVPAFHYGADTIYTPPEDLEKIASRHPNVPVLAVHMGGGGQDMCKLKKPT